MLIKPEKSVFLNNIPNIAHGFFSREGGVSSGPFNSLNCSYLVGDEESNVAINRAKASNILGFSNLIMPTLCHGADFLIADSTNDLQNLIKTPVDGIITKESNLAIGVSYADCLPILVASNNGEWIAAIHAGWRGLVKGIIANCISYLKAHLSANCHLLAAIGPAISKESFIVKSDVADIFSKYWAKSVFYEQDGIHIDLVDVAISQLRELGVEKIGKVGGYTDLDPARYFSHRKLGPHTGRHVAIIAKHSTHAK